MDKRRRRILKRKKRQRLYQESILELEKINVSLATDAEMEQRFGSQ